MIWGVVEVEFDPVADSDGGGLIDAYEDFNHNGVVDPWETDPNNPADDTLVLSVRDFHPGQRSSMRIWNGTPQSSVWILYSLAGSGPTDIGFGILMDLAQPIQVASKVDLDAAGALSWTGPRLPAGAPIGTNVWIQGLQLTWNAGLQLAKTNALLLPIGAN